MVIELSQIMTNRVLQLKVEPEPPVKGLDAQDFGRHKYFMAAGLDFEILVF